jgi:hypothetical protein
MDPMTNHHVDTGSQSGTQSPGSEGPAEQVREEAGHLKQASTDAARQVAGTVKDKALDVGSDVREQTRRLAGQTRDQLTEQVGQQQERAAHNLRSVSNELRGMAEHGQSGWGTQLVRQGADFSEQAADFLQKREPGDLLEEVRGFARRRPGTFLIVAATAGILAGRLTRALAAGTPGSHTADRRTTAAPEVFDDDYFVPPPPASTPTVATPFEPPPVLPDPDPGAPVTQTFAPGSER